MEGSGLLGAARKNGNLLDWEDDIYISVVLDKNMTWEKLTAGLTKRCAQDDYFVDLFQKQGLISISYDPPQPWPLSWD